MLGLKAETKLVSKTMIGASFKRPLGNAASTQSKRHKANDLSQVHFLRQRESQLMKEGFKYIIGTDEAGRGPLAGPVVAAACYVPPHIVIDGVGDSKALTEEQREDCFRQLTSHPKILFGISIQDNHVIDKINILAASLRAMAESVAKIDSKMVSYVLVDGNRDPPFPKDLPFETVVKGDSSCYCIAAASIIAKVTRDHIMDDLDKKYPLYQLAQHKGYPTAAHRALVLKHGPSEVHRITFAPIKDMEGVDLTGTYIDPINIAKRKIEKKKQAMALRSKAMEKKRASVAKSCKKLTDFFFKRKAASTKD